MCGGLARVGQHFELKAAAIYNREVGEVCWGGGTGQSTSEGNLQGQACSHSRFRHLMLVTETDVATTLSWTRPVPVHPEKCIDTGDRLSMIGAALACSGSHSPISGPQPQGSKLRSPHFEPCADHKLMA